MRFPQLPGGHGGGPDSELFRAERLGVQVQRRLQQSYSQVYPPAVVLVILSAALPTYSQALFIKIGVPSGVAPTPANIVNIPRQVIISYPTMKFWAMPDQK